jgi:hypothetical protein
MFSCIVDSAHGGDDDMNKKFVFGLLASLLLAGVVGCSNDKQSSDKNMNDKTSQKMDGNKMNMSAKEMKNMKKDDKK